MTGACPAQQCAPPLRGRRDRWTGTIPWLRQPCPARPRLPRPALRLQQRQANLRLQAQLHSAVHRQPGKFRRSSSLARPHRPAMQRRIRHQLPPRRRFRSLSRRRSRPRYRRLPRLLSKLPRPVGIGPGSQVRQDCSLWSLRGFGGAAARILRFRSSTSNLPWSGRNPLLLRLNRWWPRPSRRLRSLKSRRSFQKVCALRWRCGG